MIALAGDAASRPQDGPGSSAFKQVLDLAIAAVAMTVTAPLFLLIALLIKLNSRGPVLYTQERVGKNGRVFRFYKFRTMQHNADDSVHREFSRNFIRGRGHNGNGNGTNGQGARGRVANGNGNAGAVSGHNGNGNGNGNGASARRATDESETGSIYKMTSDPRVTGVGRLLRRASLDELPQLLNVLRGDMSLVGPRPPVLYELEHYQDWHKRRLHVKPGITGLWQVSGRSSVPFDEMVQLDLHYIDNRNMRMDLWIMARTLPAMVRGDGAY